MKMNIGENIRALRREKGVTQEQLAQSIGISFQAVSKWENGITMPDITLVPVLAAYFGVSTDRLLNFDRRRMDEEIEAIVDKAYEFRETEPARAREMLEEGLEKYPDNDILLTNMLYVMDYSRAPDDTIALASKIIAKTDVSDIRYDALRFLAYAYNAKGDKKAAVAALEQVPELYFTKLSEMAFIAEGEAKYEAAEKQLWISFETVLQMLWKIAECCEANGDRDGALMKINQALAMLESMSGEKKSGNFDGYRDFFRRHLERLG